MNIIELAKQAGFKRYQKQAPGIDGVVGNWEDLEKFAALVAAHEREECAQVCETLLGPTAKGFYGNRYAKAIRARGTT